MASNNKSDNKIEKLIENRVHICACVCLCATIEMSTTTIFMNETNENYRDALHDNKRLMRSI